MVGAIRSEEGQDGALEAYDLVIDDERHGEIKTCYRVDQLGSCNACGAVVSSLETECAVCRSTSINRKDDSKWLIAIRNNADLCNKFADEIYLPKIVLKKADIPLSLRSQFIDLR